MVNVKFLKHYPPYCSGETASFSDEIAKRLTTRKVAVYEQQPQPESAPAAKDGDKNIKKA